LSIRGVTRRRSEAATGSQLQRQPAQRSIIGVRHLESDLNAGVGKPGWSADLDDKIMRRIDRVAFDARDDANASASWTQRIVACQEEQQAAREHDMPHSAKIPNGQSQWKDTRAKRHNRKR